MEGEGVGEMKWFNSADCPWWMNLITLVVNLYGVLRLWHLTPSHDVMLWFTFMVWTCVVNIDHMLTKLGRASSVVNKPLDTSVS